MAVSLSSEGGSDRCNSGGACPGAWTDASSAESMVTSIPICFKCQTGRDCVHCKISVVCEVGTEQWVLIAVRDRCVVYAGATHYNTQEPTTVPAEWHGWLNHSTDANPTNVSRAGETLGRWLLALGFAGRLMGCMGCAR